MKNLDGHVAFTIVLVGITCTTIGHYAEWWAVSYLAAILAALVAGAVFSE